ncbi:hypothetical protein Btru_007403 [Bulinus truncatus]|nr:hypothetical protein Btru_007403 [Bulinus truncatus]
MNRHFSISIVTVAAVTSEEPSQIDSSNRQVSGHPFWILLCKTVPPLHLPPSCPSASQLEHQMSSSTLLTYSDDDGQTGEVITLKFKHRITEAEPRTSLLNAMTGALSPGAIQLTGVHTTATRKRDGMNTFEAYMTCHILFRLNLTGPMLIDLT